MPKCTLVVPFDKFHGRILDALGGSGQVVFSSAKSANVSRQYVIPSNPQTSLQVTVRNILSQSAAAFKGLTAQNAELWNGDASGITRTNILNLDYTLSGISYYCMINSYRLLAGVAQSETPPVGTPPIAPSGINSLVYTSGAETLDIEVDCSGMTDGDQVMVRMSAPNIPANRKTTPGILSYPDTDTSACFGTVAAGVATVQVDASHLGYSDGDAARLGVLPLSEGFIPGTVRYFAADVTAP